MIRPQIIVVASMFFDSRMEAGSSCNSGLLSEIVNTKSWYLLRGPFGHVRYQLLTP